MGISLAKYNFTAEQAAGDFPWDIYEDGWNGKSLKVNKNVKCKDHNVKVYSHEKYAKTLYNKFMKLPEVYSKEVTKNSIVKISDLNVLNDNTVMASINNGANNIIIDLDKEAKFFNTISVGEDKLTKETFVQYLQNPKLKSDILSMDLNAQIGTDVAKGSIWDGYIASLTNEMKAQVKLNNKAYMATILSTNKGGFVVEIMNVIKAFMPGSMAASNRLTDYESMVGKQLEVMVESFDNNTGFVVSRKKFLNTIKPIKLHAMAETLKKNQDTVFTGHITGSSQFGIYVELDEYLTGMIHKSLVSDERREEMRQEAANYDATGMRGTVIVPGTEISVYVHRIENDRIILSDVPSTERDIVIARREAEDELEKAAHNANKASKESNN